MSACFMFSRVSSIIYLTRDSAAESAGLLLGGRGRFGRAWVGALQGASLKQAAVQSESAFWAIKKNGAAEKHDAARMSEDSFVRTENRQASPGWRRPGSLEAGYASVGNSPKVPGNLRAALR